MPARILMGGFDKSSANIDLEQCRAAAPASRGPPSPGRAPLPRQAALQRGAPARRVRAAARAQGNDTVLVSCVYVVMMLMYAHVEAHERLIFAGMQLEDGMAFCIFFFLNFLDKIVIDLR